MQTRFTAEQLTDADTAASEQILRKCVHCGFCTATCPTYVLLGDELDGPRGRIYLIKDMLENDRAATPDVVRHLDRCLSCLACMTTCPSGVHYQHLIDHARVHVEKTYRRPWKDRLIRAALAAVLPHPNRFAGVAALGRFVRPAAGLLPARLERLLRLVPSVPRRAPDAAVAARDSGAAQAKVRVALLDGCVQSVLSPRINAAAERLLRLAGAEVVRVPGCCGAIVHHLGRAADNRELAGRLISRLGRSVEAGGTDRIAVTASGCGTHTKDYGFIFRADPELANPAAAVSERVRDISELLDELGLPAPPNPPGGAVAYHSACSMQHGQRIERQPRDLLSRAGFAVVEIGEGHLCCGSAGTYNLLQPDIAEALRDRKLAHIAHTGAPVVATGNIGCMTQLSSAASVPVVHTVELLDWAYGGPAPTGVGSRQADR